MKNNGFGEKAEGRIKDISKHTANLEFELKFKHVLERLHTQKAMKIAKEKIQFMKSLFEKLKMETKGEL